LTPYSSGVQEGLGYDASSRLVTETLAGPASSPATTTLSSSYAYGYNPLNWTTSTTTLSGTDTLTHDAQGRLTSESGPQVVATGGTYKWTYDNNGNILSQIGDNGFPVTYTYTQAITPNQLQTMVMGDGQPTAYYGYDNRGDTTAITNSLGAVNPVPKNALNTYISYDSQARPVQITFLDRVAPSTVTVTATVTLAYNPAGQRSEYTLAEPGQPTLDEQFTYRDSMLGQARVTKGGTLLYTDTYLYTDAGAPYELLRTTSNGTTNRYWYELDGRGNVVALTDITGKVVDRYAYDSWGELTSNDSTDETVPQQLRYAGYWYDEKLSWYWLSVRYYDPEIERFLAPDPSEQDGVRTYAYAGDDPIDATDPSGLDTGAGSAGSPVDDFIEAFTLFAGAVVVVAHVQRDLIGTGIHAGGVLLIDGKNFIVSVIKYGNPASIPVPCTTAPSGPSVTTPVLGGTTLTTASSCTAATVIPVYIESVTVPNSHVAGGIAGEIENLNGKTRAEADALLRSRGATVRTSAGGYKRYLFPDGSEIWIRSSPDNEVIRLEAPQYGPNGARTNRGQRLGPNGERLPRSDPASHTTGERVID